MDINSTTNYLQTSSNRVTDSQSGQPSEKKITTDAAAAMLPVRELIHKDKSELSISDEIVVKAIEKANKAIEGVGKRFEYSVHKKTGDIIVKVINKDTNEVIREIPPEKIIDLVAKLQEIVGVIIDERR
jgi:flagellar protein FlaG